MTIAAIRFGYGLHGKTRRRETPHAHGVAGARAFAARFFERLAWFWSGHFALGGKTLLGKTLAGRFEAEALRPHLAGPFNLLLRAAITHPAMLRYLDQGRAAGPNSPAGGSAGAGLNENLAREIIELHTLGVSANCTQADVGPLARLLTGLSFDRRMDAAEFRLRRAEPGA